MPDEAPAARPSFVAIDLTRADARAFADGRVARVPAAVFGDEAGGVCFGDQAVRRGLTAPAGLEPALPEWIDDDVLALGMGLHRVPDLLRGLLAHAISGVWPGLDQAGLDRRVLSGPELLVLVVPEHWGGPRRGLIARCAAGLAGHVELLSSAKAILLGALADAPGTDLRKVVVVEQERDRALAWVLPATGTAPSPRAGEALASAIVDGSPCGGGPAGECVDSAVLSRLLRRAVGSGLPESAVMIAPRGGRELPAALWAAVPAHSQIVDGDCALRGAVMFGNSASGQF